MHGFRNRRSTACARMRRLLFEPLEDRSLLACDLIVTNTLNSGAGSLREAINCANSNGLDDIIMVPAGQYDLSGTANEDANAGGDLDLKEANHSLTIHGAGADQTIISAGGIDRVLQVFANVTAVLEGLSITGGSATSGGGILNAGNLTLNDTVVYSNAAATGGGIQSSASLALNRSTIHDNVAAGTSAAGGGLYFTVTGFETLSITDSELSRNTIDVPSSAGNLGIARGGGIYLSGGTTQIVDTTIDANRVTAPQEASGGGIYVVTPAFSFAQLNLTRVIISNNILESAKSSLGAGIDAVATISISQSTIRDNQITGPGLGAGIDQRGGKLTITQSTVSGNSINSPASGAGAGIRMSSAPLTMINSTISGNTITGAAGFTSTGGGITTSTNPVLIRNSTITGNRVIQGTTGGLDATFTSGGTPSVMIHNTIVAGNFAGTDGATSSDIVGQVNVGTAESPTSFNNLVGDAATSGGLANGVNGNMVGNSGSGVIDINLVLNPALADNGGSTLTHALALNSPAVDGGTLAQALNSNVNIQPLSKDQRGFPRFLGQDIDIGAYEFAEPPCNLIVTNTNDSGFGSFRQAIICANSLPGADTISFNIPGDGVHTITPLSSLPNITDALLVDGYSQPGSSPNTNAIDDPDPAKRGLNGKLLIQISGPAGFTPQMDGLSITGDGSTIRGLVINRVSHNGIFISGDNNVVTGNYIGTDPTGLIAAGNLAHGVYAFVGAAGNRIGTDGDGVGDAAERNLISDNLAGILIAGFSSAPANQTVVAGNFIGVDSTGTAALGNRNRGIEVNGQNNRIGTNADGIHDGAERNIISGNAAVGVLLRGASFTVVAGNWIGVDVTGGSALPNANVGEDRPGGVNPKGGVSISGGATNNTIGGLAIGAGNVIAFNKFHGLNVIDAETTNNSILGNSIFANGGLGIDLINDGVTPNDLVPTPDADTGHNNLQNFPEISYATRDAGKLKVTYNVPSAPSNSTYPLRIEFFLADTTGQGQNYLGFDTFLDTDFSSGGKTATFATAVPINVFDKIVATATDSLIAASGGGPANTSEFSVQATILSPWQNPGRLRWDVNNDTLIVADDVLDVINYINAVGSGKVPDTAANQKRYYDVDGDNNVTAMDVLDVINYINAGKTLGGEWQGSRFGGQRSVETGQETENSDLTALLAADVEVQAARKRRP
jgi:hypothetical protein